MSDWTFPYSTLDRVVDGDSFYANVSRTLDFGFHVTTTMSSRQKFRLNRCNAAPIATPSGVGAAVRSKELLSANPFFLESVGAYKYGDVWMAEVSLIDGRNLADVLIAEQWAMPWTGDGPQPMPPWPRTV